MIGGSWDDLYQRGTAPWDIGRPQQAIARIADAGHFVPWEKPEAVAAALEPFIAAAHGA